VLGERGTGLREPEREGGMDMVVVGYHAKQCADESMMSQCAARPACN
jgi:hypothetical protein